ncbi:MAG: DUF4440 domain-containing protein [Aristaeellaceae bacterium]
MTDRILELEKSLLSVVCMSDRAYLEAIMDDDYLEIGQSGRIFTKADEIRALSAEKDDRRIVICNFTCQPLDDKVFLAHYLTKSGEDIIYRTSIWRMENGRLRIVFHQASLYREPVDLVES